MDCSSLHIKAILFLVFSEFFIINKALSCQEKIAVFFKTFISAVIHYLAFKNFISLKMPIF